MSQSKNSVPIFDLRRYILSEERNYPDVLNKTRVKQLTKEFFGASTIASKDGSSVFASAPMDMPARKACLDLATCPGESKCQTPPSGTCATVVKNCMCRAFQSSTRNMGKVFEVRNGLFHEVFAMGSSNQQTEG